MINSVIHSLSTNQANMTTVNIAVLDMNLESLQSMGNDFKKMLEQSVNPNIGQNIDITV